MSTQLALAGFDAPSAPTDSLFFALFLDAAAREQTTGIASRLQQQHGLRGKPLAADRLHVTLHHVGDHIGLRQDLVQRAMQAAASITMPPLALRLDRVGSFTAHKRNLPLVLQCADDALAPLRTFQQQLGTAMRLHGLGSYVNPRFTPHVTLMYDDQSLALQPIEPVAWTATEFVLVHSLLGRTHYLPLAHWSAQEGPPCAPR